MQFDEMNLLRLQLSGGLDGSMDLLALIAFLAFAAAYLLLPALGYGEERPSGFTSALYMLIGYAGLSLIQRLAQLGLFTMLDSNRFNGRGEPAAVLAMFIFPILKTGVFLLSMIVFVSGLRGLNQQRPPQEFFREPPDDDFRNK